MADGAQATRHTIDPHPFTAIAHAEQPSAWTTGLEWGGGLFLMALALALTYATIRPTPGSRRREPPAAAPAWAKARRRSS
jgi:hypothetical protein